MIITFTPHAYLFSLENHRNKIEQYGVVLEKMGLTPVAARVFIYLMLAPEHQATFEDLVSYFNVSKSAVSNALKTLEDVNMAKSKTVGGQRKRYFSVSLSSMVEEQQVTAKIKVFYHMLDDLQKVRGIDDDFAAELASVSILYKMMLVEFPIILERWKRTIAMNPKQE